MNQRANKPAELIAKYIDLVMRGGSRAVGAVGGDDEVEAALDRALVLFRYIQVHAVLGPPGRGVGRQVDRGGWVHILRGLQCRKGGGERVGRSTGVLHMARCAAPCL